MLKLKIVGKLFLLKGFPYPRSDPNYKLVVFERAALLDKAKGNLYGTPESLMRGVNGYFNNLEL